MTPHDLVGKRLQFARDAVARGEVATADGRVIRRLVVEFSGEGEALATTVMESDRIDVEVRKGRIARVYVWGGSGE